MSFHNHPKYQIPGLIESLKAHGLVTDKPSQLSDAFRAGWIAATNSAPAASFHKLLKQAHDEIVYLHASIMQEAGLESDGMNNSTAVDIRAAISASATPVPGEKRDAERWRRLLFAAGLEFPPIAVATDAENEPVFVYSAKKIIELVDGLDIDAAIAAAAPKEPTT